MTFPRDLSYYPWWLYVVVVISFFLVAFILNYILKKINEGRFQGRFYKGTYRAIQVPRSSNSPAHPRIPTKVVFEHPKSPTVTRISLINNSDNYLKENLKIKDKIKVKNYSDSIKVSVASSANLSMERIANQKEQELTNKNFENLIPQKEEIIEIPIEFTSTDVTKSDYLGTICKELNTESNKKDVFEHPLSVTSNSLVNNTEHFLESKQVVDNEEVKQSDEKRVITGDEVKKIPLEVKDLNTVITPKVVFDLPNTANATNISLIDNSNNFLEDNLKIRDIIEVKSFTGLMKIARSAKISMEKAINQKSKLLINETSKKVINQIHELNEMPMEVTSNDTAKPNILGAIYKELNTISNSKKVLLEHSNLPTISKNSLTNCNDNYLNQHQSFFDLLKVPVASNANILAQNVINHGDKKVMIEGDEAAIIQNDAKVIINNEEEVYIQRDKIKEMKVELTRNTVIKQDFFETIHKKLSTVSNGKLVFEHPNMPTLTSILINNDNKYLKENLRLKDILKVTSISDFMKGSISNNANISMDELIKQIHEEVLYQTKEIPVKITSNDVTEPSFLGTIYKELAAVLNANVVFEHPNSPNINSISLINNSAKYLTEQYQCKDISMVNSFVDSKTANSVNMSMEESINQKGEEQIIQTDKVVKNQEDEEIINKIDEEVINEKVSSEIISNDVIREGLLESVHNELSPATNAINSKSLIKAGKDEILEKIVDKMVLKLRATKSAPSFKKLLYVQNEEELMKWALDLIEKNDSEDNPTTSK